MWAIHVQGPDTIIAQPDKATAESRAAQWQKAIDDWLATRIASPYYPTIKYVVVKYPGRYESWRAQIDEHGGEPEDHC